MSNRRTLEHMHKKFEINQTKIKDSCQSGRNAIAHEYDSKSDLPLEGSLCFVSKWPRFLATKTWSLCYSLETSDPF